MNSKSRSRDGAVVPFHVRLALAMTSGAVQTPLTPSQISSSRLAAEADNWAHFRWQNVKFRVHHGAITGDVAVGFVGGVQDTLPSTLATVSELIPATYYGSTYTVPSEWINVPKQDLAGPLPWYKALPGAASNVEELPGYLCMAGAGTDTVVVELRGVCVFKTAVAPANTPLAIELRQKLRIEASARHSAHEQRRVAALLAGPTAQV